VWEWELKRKGCEKGKLGSVGAGRVENNWYVNGCKETVSVVEDSTLRCEEIRWKKLMEDEKIVIDNEERLKCTGIII
jgi:hypothetical protein